MSNKTIVIAEAGENHCGDIQLAYELIDMSTRAGCDYVKFQLYDSAKVSSSDPEKEWFKQVEVSDSMWQDLIIHSKKTGIEPLATPWDIEKAEVILKSGATSIKIASFHIIDLELLEFVNINFNKVFLSTGMSSMLEIEKAIATLRDVKELYVLHCVSEYPLPPENVNLNIISTLQNKFPKISGVGYSDHTIGIFAPVLAVSMGAKVIEKHITTNKNLEGTDHILSADSKDLTEMVRQIRLTEIMLGTSEKKLTPFEQENQEFLRERFHNVPS
jgi:sialic acid synthase SpsE